MRESEIINTRFTRLYCDKSNSFCALNGTQTRLALTATNHTHVRMLTCEQHVTLMTVVEAAVKAATNGVMAHDATDKQTVRQQ